MPKFTRYRDQHGHEFSSGLSLEAAEAKGWSVLDEPAVDSNDKPLKAKPADRKELGELLAAKQAETEAEGDAEPDTDPAAKTEGDPKVDATAGKTAPKPSARMSGSGSTPPSSAGAGSSNAQGA